MRRGLSIRASRRAFGRILTCPRYANRIEVQQQLERVLNHQPVGCSLNCVLCSIFYLATLFVWAWECVLFFLNEEKCFEFNCLSVQSLCAGEWVTYSQNLLNLRKLLWTAFIVMSLCQSVRVIIRIWDRIRMNNRHWTDNVYCLFLFYSSIPSTIQTTNYRRTSSHQRQLSWIECKIEIMRRRNSDEELFPENSCSSTLEF